MLVLIYHTPEGWKTELAWAEKKVKKAEPGSNQGHCVASQRSYNCATMTLILLIYLLKLKYFLFGNGS